MNTCCHTVCCMCTVTCFELNWILSMFSLIRVGIVHYILLCIFVMVEFMQNINSS